MTVNIGVIGTGNIGTYHAHRIATELPGAGVVSVFDVDVARAQQVAEAVGARVHEHALDVISDSEADAVLIASPGDLHAEQVLACLDAGKPVLCEKPLATASEDALKVVEAEVGLGRQLIQVGFMRRYDAAYNEVKATLDSGDIGEALVLHCVHRNPTVPPTFREFMAITDSVVHEIDTSRWLLGDEIVAVTVRSGKRSPHAAGQDPQMVHFETASGVLVDVESFVNCQYGYDVRCELVGSEGFAQLENPTFSSVTRAAQRRTGVPADWQERFDNAYQRELLAWVHGVGTGAYSGASAWDGYAATAVAEAGVRSLDEGGRVAVDLVDKPSLYGGKGSTA
ncbi:MAG TPA: Gfo/Idh/MocA family oxidoreductase [Nocardioidaceae bacterium]